MSAWTSYKGSVYQQLFGNFFEYFRKYCGDQDFSRSAWLEHELGRYQKKVGELMEANAKLRKDAEGLDQLRMAFDAWIIQIALAYGEAVKDPDTGEDIPRMKALHLEMPKVSPTLRNYEIHQRVDEKNMMHIAVGLRDDPTDSKTEVNDGADIG